MIIGARSTKLATRDVEVVPGAGVEPARPQGRGILSPLCLPIPPSGRRKPLYLPENGRRESACGTFPSRSGAGKESRTLDLYLGKVSLYQLSYSRVRHLVSCRRTGTPSPSGRSGTDYPQAGPGCQPLGQPAPNGGWPGSCRPPGTRSSRGTDRSTRRHDGRRRRPACVSPTAQARLPDARTRAFGHNAVPGGKLAVVGSP